MKWTQFLMVLICAALSFGGSFSCRGESGDADDDDEVIIENTAR